METTIEKGWSYIVAIFHTLLNESKNNESLIEPQYIFRGITKRWFTTSTLIENEKEIIFRNLNENINEFGESLKKRIEQLDIDHMESKDCYDILYERLKSSIQAIENAKGPKTKGEFEDKAKGLLEMIMNPIDSTGTKSNIHKDYEYCVPEFINSGAVVRLKEGGTYHPSNLDFVNYIKHMLNDLKRYPEYNRDDITDIDILADVQHKGAATCLADFSTDFLTSLWFATESLDHDIGYLFCYDINKALIQDDKLFILNKKHLDRNIEDLLYETTKKTKYSGNKQYRYWLWRPSILNERIKVQGSVFIFGLEPFKIKENGIIAIPIPPSWKKPIQHVLKSFFGITAESVYSDVEGYADANSKTRPYTKTFTHFFNEEFDKVPNKEEKISFNYLQCGIDCLFQGEYRLALKYLSLYEAQPNNDYTKNKFEKMSKNISRCKNKLKFFTLNTDVLYSKGICLKHLGDEYGAIKEFKEAYETCKEINQTLTKWIKRRESSDEQKQFNIYQEYIQSKQEKAFNDLVEMYFITHQYDEVFSLISETSSKNHDWLYLMIKEAKCCLALESFLSSLKKYSDTSMAIENCHNSWLRIDNEKNKIELINKLEHEQPLLYVLNSFFDSLLNYFCFPVKSMSEISIEDDFIERFFDKRKFKLFEISRNKVKGNQKIWKSSGKSEIITNWDLRNIENLIHEIGIFIHDEEIHDDYYKVLVMQLQHMNNFIIDIQGKIKSTSQS